MIKKPKYISNLYIRNDRNDDILMITYSHIVLDIKKYYNYRFNVGHIWVISGHYRIIPIKNILNQYFPKFKCPSNISVSPIDNHD